MTDYWYGCTFVFQKVEQYEKKFERNFFFDQFDSDKKRQPTCFDDCQEDTQNKWLDSLDRDALVSLAKKLASTIKKIGKQFNLAVD